MWGGVHFRSAIEAGHTLGHQLGENAYQYLKRHIDGSVPPLP
jgi:hypothetical protein